MYKDGGLNEELDTKYSVRGTRQGLRNIPHLTQPSQAKTKCKLIGRSLTRITSQRPAVC